MELIIHRVNKIKKLKTISTTFGIEIDIRSKGSKLILNHEPFLQGDSFANYLDNYNHGTLVLNLKEAGIENDVLNLVNKKKLSHFFYYMLKCLICIQQQKKVKKILQLDFQNMKIY